MPNSKQLSEYENRQIIAYRKSEMSGHEIARKINRSKTISKFFEESKKSMARKSINVFLLLLLCAGNVLLIRKTESCTN